MRQPGDARSSVSGRPPGRRRWLRRSAAAAIWLPSAIVLWRSRPYHADMAAQFAIHAPAPLAALTLVFLAFRWRGPALSCGLATLFLLALIRLHTSAPTHWGNA